MMNRMVVANLAHRPTRSLITMSAVALEVAMILLVVAVFYGYLNGSKDSQMGVGADLLVMPPGSLLIGTSGAPISEKVANVLGQISHVTVAAPVYWAFSQKPLEIVYGIDLATYDALTPPFRYVSGGPFEHPRDVIVDDYYSSMNRKKVGDTIDVLNNQFRICGIVPHGKGGRKFLALKTMQEYLSMMTPDNLPGFNVAIEIVIGIAVIVGFLVIFQSMYTAVMERTREIGILKSLGAR